VDGLVVLELERGLTDGTTHELFEPKDFIARLAALVPELRVNLAYSNSVLARNSALVKPAKAGPTRVSTLTILVSVGLFVAIDRSWPNSVVASTGGSGRSPLNPKGPDLLEVGRNKSVPAAGGERQAFFRHRRAGDVAAQPPLSRKHVVDGLRSIRRRRTVHCPKVRARQHARL